MIRLLLLIKAILNNPEVTKLASHNPPQPKPTTANSTQPKVAVPKMDEKLPKPTPKATALQAPSKAHSEIAAPSAKPFQTLPSPNLTTPIPTRNLALKMTFDKLNHNKKMTNSSTTNPSTLSLVSKSLTSTASSPPKDIEKPKPELGNQLHSKRIFLLNNG